MIYDDYEFFLLNWNKFVVPLFMASKFYNLIFQIISITCLQLHLIYKD